MVLSCQNIAKAFGTDQIIKDASFHIEANEKAAIVGINGSGKTTLLRIIMQELKPDQGQVMTAKGKTKGYLPQNPNITGNHSIYEEVLSAKAYVISLEERIRQMEAGLDSCPASELETYMDSYNRMHHEFEQLNGYTYKSEVSGVLKGLGFGEAEFKKRMQELSGGQKTRVCLAKLLVSKPDIILLDEPTNHLDISSVAWLESFLSNYRGGVLLVSHDRYFLDRVVNKVIELDQTKVQTYTGNYTSYATKREQIREAKLKQYYNQQQEIKHQEEVITKLKSFNREKSIRRAESREKMLNKIERLEKPTEENTDMHLQLNPRIVSGNDVLMVEQLEKSYPTQKLFTDLTFSIKRGEKVALIGDNGTGKTTILKIINEMVAADQGTITLGANVHIGYYDQEHQILNMEKNLMAEISDAYPDLTVTQIRNVLAAFLFTGDEVFKTIGDLSGGERGRLSLAKLMLSQANLLILDEPTNHLDITSKEILERALVHYTGTVLFVSHDRYFINKTAQRILELTGTQLIPYLGNYDYYLEKCEKFSQLFGAAKETTSPIAEGESNTKINWKKQKEDQAKKRKRANELKKTEAMITQEEERMNEIESAFSDEVIASNPTQLMQLQTEYEAGKLRLEQLYEDWERLELEEEEQHG